MRIGLDCDGVLADFATGWRQQYNEWFNAHVDFDAKDEAWNSIVDDTHFHTEADFWAWVDSVPNFWVNIPVIPGAMGGVLELLRAGHELTIITHRHEKASMQTLQWLRRHWPLNEERQPWLPIVHHTKRKTQVDCQLYVDDGPKPLKQFAEEGRKVIKFSYPYNKTAPATASVKDWDELVKLVNEMSEALA